MDHHLPHIAIPTVKVEPESFITSSVEPDNDNKPSPSSQAHGYPCPADNLKSFYEAIQIRYRVEEKAPVIKPISAPMYSPWSSLYTTQNFPGYPFPSPSLEQNFGDSANPNSEIQPGSASTPTPEGRQYATGPFQESPTDFLQPESSARSERAGSLDDFTPPVSRMDSSSSGVSSVSSQLPEDVSGPTPLDKSSSVPPRPTTQFTGHLGLEIPDPSAAAIRHHVQQQQLLHQQYQQYQHTLPNQPFPKYHQMMAQYYQPAADPSDMLNLNRQFQLSGVQYPSGYQLSTIGPEFLPPLPFLYGNTATSSSSSSSVPFTSVSPSLINPQEPINMSPFTMVGSEPLPPMSTQTSPRRRNSSRITTPTKRGSTNSMPTDLEEMDEMGMDELDHEHEADGVEKNGMMWGMPTESYRSLSARERKRVRNRISARTFRARRKEHLSVLETDLADRNSLVKAAQDEIKKLRDENTELLRRLSRYEK